ncbi:MAG: arsenate reductase family protein [Sulfurimonas sp.]|nr:arsenate reductase family protein [Sulfurimonas sp.]
MRLYGIPTCGSVRKARKFFKENEIDLEFIDFKKTSVDCVKVDKWLEQTEMNLLFNSRGTKYRTLKLKDLNLDESSKREWLCKENMLLKRPIIEYKGQVIVGFDEESYRKIFL